MEELDWSFESGSDSDAENREEEAARRRELHEAKYKVETIQLSIDVLKARQKGDVTKYCNNGANKFAPGLFFEDFSVTLYQGQSGLGVGGKEWYISLEPTPEEIMTILKAALRELQGELDDLINNIEE